MDTARHACPDCGRTYRAVETLNRHRKNHSETAAYVCEVCGASFRRGDIRDRHMKIHATDAPSGEKRAVRACVRCSSLKTKCDGEWPCLRCAKAGHHCEYAENHGRAKVSRVDQSASLPLEIPETRLTAVGASYQAETTNETDLSFDFGPLYYDQQQSEPLLSDQGTNSLWPENVALGANNQQFDDMLWEFAGEVPDTGFLLTDAQRDIPDPQQTFYTSGDMLWNYTTLVPTATPGALQGVPAPFEALQANVDDTVQVSQWAQPLGPMLHFNHPPTTAWAMSASSSTVLQGKSLATDNQTIDIEQPHMPSVSNKQTYISQDQVVDEFVEWVLESLSSGDINEKVRAPSEWQSISNKIEVAFDCGTNGSSNAVQSMLSDFFQRFHPSWPMLSDHYLSHPFELPAHLVLTISAIGAGYAGETEAHFHRLVLKALRIHLTRATFEQDLDNDALLYLCQSLAYIQAAIMYFGHTTAFPFLQQLGTLTTTMARKLDIFSEINELATRRTDNNGADVYRQLALSILKLEALNSLLTDARPSLTFAEIHLHFPDTSLEQAESDNTASDRRRQQYTLCDLVNICMDRNEQLPNMGAADIERVIYGLQAPIWRNSYTRILAMRPTLNLNFDKLTLDGPQPVQGEMDSEGDRRQMNDLRVEHSRLISALTRWRAALANTRSSGETSQGDVLLASRLLYNVSLIKLSSHLSDMHHVALSCVRNSTPRQDKVESIHKWALSKVAEGAVRHACSTWSLVAVELSKAGDERANFDILTQVAVLNAAVVIWSFSGTRLGGRMKKNADLDGLALGQISLCRENNAVLMESFVNLVKEVTPTWTPGNSQYVVTISALIEKPLPWLEQKAS